MKVTIDANSPVPIYAQVQLQLRRAITSGTIPPGGRLPTVRQLAVDLRINPNTVQRAYMGLEHEGLVATRRGLGSFVRSDRGTSGGHGPDRLDQVIEQALGEAALLGIEPRAFVDAVRSYVERSRSSNG